MLVPNIFSRSRGSGIILTASQEQRASSLSPTLPLSPRADHFGRPSGGALPSPKTAPRSPLQMPESPLRPPQMPRSQTSPFPSSDVKGREKSSQKPRPSIEPLNLSPPKDDEISAADEICFSPSWSDHGEKQRKRDKKKAEKEQKNQKEREKKSKQEEDKQRLADIKLGKRLSKKPPPAAMETQKMPSALRRNSWISIISSHSVSGENTARSSREDRRPSLISLGSIRSSRRSHSTPPTNTEGDLQENNNSETWRPIVSPSAPKLPSFRWSSRRSPPDSGKSDSLASDDAYERDLITFAYRLDASAFMAEPGKNDKSRSQQSSRLGTPHQQPGTPALSRSSTEPNLPSATPTSKALRSPPRSPTTKGGVPEGGLSNPIKSPSGEQESPRISPGDSARAIGDMTADRNHSLSRNPPSPRSPLPQLRSSHDGISYVHKQRMYQQQLSIAGFEEQQAVKDANDFANELAAEYESLLVEEPSSVLSKRGRTASPGRLDASGITQSTEVKKVRIDRDNVSPVSFRQRHRSSSPRTESTSSKYPSRGPTPLSQETSQTDDTELDTEEARLRASIQSNRGVSLGRPQAPTGFKRDKILGFRRRTKEPPAIISVPYNTGTQILAVQSAPLEAPQSDEPPVKRSKMERLFRESRPSNTESNSRIRSSSLTRNQLGEDAAQSSPSQSHSRTRTASSTVLNDSLITPLVKTKTEPALTSPTKSAKQPPVTKAVHSHQSDGKSELETKADLKAEKLRSKPEEPVKSAKGKTRSIADEKPSGSTGIAAELSNTVTKESKRTKKSPAEVLVQSETGDGLVRKASLTRPRSNPQLQTQTTANNSLPSLDFLPKLKHQPLVKRERQSPTRSAQADSSPSTSQFPSPLSPLTYHSPSSINAPDLKLIPRSPRRPPSQFPLPSGSRHNRSATDVGTISTFGKGALAEGLDAKPVAKLFVICCKCKFWHDLPSKLYEAMALPKELHKAEEGKLTGARLETAVRCPWCEHAMTTFCCQGWTTVVYLHERHH